MVKDIYRWKIELGKNGKVRWLMGHNEGEALAMLWVGSNTTNNPIKDGMGNNDRLVNL